MTHGKHTCETLKAIRQQIADANDIQYTPKKCSFKGECNGTCPACEQERQYIEQQLSMKQKAGHVIKIVGLAAGMTMAVCNEAQAQTTIDSLAIENKETHFAWEHYYPEMYGDMLPIEVLTQFKEIAEFILQFPNEKFLITGHSDERGSATYNNKFSESRAKYIKSMLVEQGVQPDQLISYGCAFYNPRIPNATTEHEHDQNRHVTIEFYESNQQMGKTGANLELRILKEKIEQDSILVNYKTKKLIKQAEEELDKLNQQPYNDSLRKSYNQLAIQFKQIRKEITKK